MDVILIGLLGGLITAISPCILPVLPVIFLTAGVQSASFEGDVKPAPRSRPFLVILGLVISFTAVTLVGSLIIGALNLPPAIVRWVGIGVLVIIGIGMLVPRFEQILERPFQRFGNREVKNGGNGFGVGLALGAVFVPCAGPVLAAIIVAGATGRIGPETVLLTVAFAIGVAIPLLVFALAGRGLVERLRSFRKRERGLRITAGIAMLALAVGLVFNIPQLLQQQVPDYTAGLQSSLAEAPAVSGALGGLETDENRDLARCTPGATELAECGTAPALQGITSWLNSEPVDLADLHGRVVLIDFWAYSCINCQRSIPHVTAWDTAYRDAGLTVIGVHSPEYAFEKDAANVAAGAKDFGITYPVALDNDLATWTAYRNRYWPAHYLVDAQGVVRQIQFGEGGYANTEKLIRELLTDADASVALPVATEMADDTPKLGETTPETFLGWTKDVNFGGTEKYAASTKTFAFPAKLADDSFALDGSWDVETQFATPAAADARIELAYRAREVRMVLAGSGTVRLDDGTVIDVDGTPRSYQVVKTSELSMGEATFTVSPGVQVYTFTFG